MFLAGLLLVLVAAGMYLYFGELQKIVAARSPSAHSSDAAHDGSLPSRRMIRRRSMSRSPSRLRRELVYTITLPANISPLYQTTLYAKVSGYLKWIGPDKGDRVKKNQVLAVIDAPEVEEQYQQAVSDYKIKKTDTRAAGQSLEGIS